MPHEMGVDHALGKIETEARHEILFKLFPHECSIGFLVFHGLGSKEKLTLRFLRASSPELTVHSKGKRRRLNTESTEARAQRSQKPRRPNS